MPQQTSPEEVEILIIGGGLVGSALAIALSQRGLPATVLERFHAVPDVLRGELVMPAGVEVLRRLGVAEALFEVGVRAEGVTLHHPAFEAGPQAIDYVNAPPPLDADLERWDPVGLCGLRGDLYGVLQARAAATTGVDWRGGVEVVAMDVAPDGRRCVVARDGRRWIAQMVVAADGHHSRTRRMAGFVPIFDHRPTVVQGFIGRAAAPYLERRVHVGAHALGACFVFPFGGDRFRCTIEHREALRGTFREGGLPLHLEVLEQALPEVFCALGGASLTPTSRLHTQPGRSLALSSTVERGFALVGDAAGCLDPFTGYGMTLGLMDAEALADTLAPATHKEAYSARNLRDYEAARARRVAPRREATDAMAYMFLDPTEGFAAPMAQAMERRWDKDRWIAPLVAAEFGGFEAVMEPSVGMRGYVMGWVPHPARSGTQ